ncbi:MAG: protein kinase [Clostridiales bacterium]|nr:protein kinase [Clostridiales bacterium]
MNEVKRFEPLWGSWYVKDLIGEGSYGKVYRIEREEFGSVYKAALKYIKIPKTYSEVKSIMAEGMDREAAERYFKEFAERLVKEVQLMARVKGNSNIVSYEDHRVIKSEDKIEWHLFIKMELLTSLVDYITENKITKRDIIRLGIHICRALEVCQKHNIIHRDIKPENIFVSEDGNFKLGDFGIARQIEKTMAGLSKKGTYTYMAPEVYLGKEYGSNVDIYSLGIVMYRFLNNNRTPFLPPYPEKISGNVREVALARRMSGEVLPKPVNADGRLGEIVLKACAYNPVDRYDSPKEMRKALEAIFFAEEEGGAVYDDSHGDSLDNDSVHYTHTHTHSSEPSSDSSGGSLKPILFSEEEEGKTEDIGKWEKSGGYETVDPNEWGSNHDNETVDIDKWEHDSLDETVDIDKWEKNHDDETVDIDKWESDKLDETVDIDAWEKSHGEAPVPFKTEEKSGRDNSSKQSLAGKKAVIAVIAAVVVFMGLAAAAVSMVKSGGAITYNNGDVYEGETENGKRNGYGTMTYADGSVYTGQWENDLKNGKGTLVYASGDVYEGEWENNSISGYGTMTYADGDVYEGSWVNNYRSGSGTMTYAGGSVYDGSWLLNGYNGYGIMTYENGEVYLGNWKDSQRSGQGTMTYKNGDIYEGEWDDNLKDGTGKYTFSTGIVYEGEFKEDSITGKGTMTYADGTVETGMWLDGELVSAAG